MRRKAANQHEGRYLVCVGVDGLRTRLALIKRRSRGASSQRGVHARECVYVCGGGGRRWQGKGSRVGWCVWREERKSEQPLKDQPTSLPGVPGAPAGQQKSGKLQRITGNSGSACFWPVGGRGLRVNYVNSPQMLNTKKHLGKSQDKRRRREERRKKNPNLESHPREKYNCSLCFLSLFLFIFFVRSGHTQAPVCSPGQTSLAAMIHYLQ